MIPVCVNISKHPLYLQERKKPYVDVTREMVFEHERQIACNGDLALQLQL